MSDNPNFADKWSRMFTQQQDEVIPEASESISEYAGEAAPAEDRRKKTAKRIFRVMYHFRKVIMAVPVVLCALRLAAYNLANLPEQVGIDLQASGEFARMVSRESAVMGPLVVTLSCLVLMFCSRKTVYPWIISIFTLVLPVLLLLTNMYPA